MKMRQAGLLALVLAAAFAVGRPAHAQGIVSIGIGGGPSFPVGDFQGIDLDPGFHVQGSLRLAPPLLPLSLRGDVLFQRTAESGPGHEDHNLDVLAGIVNAVFTIPSVLVHPYFIGGAGMYNLSLDEEDISTTEAGINVGVGVRAGLGGLNAFGEIRFHNVFVTGGNMRFIPVTIGLSF